MAIMLMTITLCAWGTLCPERAQVVDLCGHIGAQTNTVEATVFADQLQ